MPDIWRIFHIRNCPHTSPVKDKFVVIVCFDGEPLGFLINSAISNFIKKRPVLLNCQIPIKSSDYWFLDHDSYIDCSRIYPFDELLLDSGRGTISENIQQQIKQAVILSPLIEKHYQKLICSN